MTKALGAAVAACAVLLAGCGGGGGEPESEIGLEAAASLDDRCANPRPETAFDPFDGRPYGDVQGSLADEKAWLRSWIDETYLWYRDVRALPAATLDPAAYATPIAWFDALKSPETTASGKRKDQYHFTYDTLAWVALARDGVEHGYGFAVSFVSRTVPRRVVVAYTDPGTPAVAAGISRGAEIRAVDGIDVRSATSSGDVAAIDAALFPTGARSHAFTILDRGATAPRTVTLAAAPLAKDPVQNVRTFPAPNERVGYMHFTDHLATSEAELVAAFRQLQVAGVADLVLDIRYNGGGLLTIASQVAYMVAGPGPTAGKTFERLLFNDRDPFDTGGGESRTPFVTTTRGYSTASGQPLPQLGLSRVFVLAGADTCSASESIVNGLRGAGVEVIHVGGPTCGKPYGFYPADNCGTTYFAIQFQGVNHLGFGDYADGFAPQCAVADDFSRDLGDPLEDRIDVALGYRATGTCVPLVGRRGPLARMGWPSPAIDRATLVRSPARENRLIDRPPR